MNSKKKGDRGELEVLHILQEQSLFCSRNQQWGVSGKGNPDIYLEHAGHRYHIECKRCENLNLHAAMVQAERDAVKAIPMVVHRKNREGWLVTLNLLDIIRLVKERQRDPFIDF